MLSAGILAGDGGGLLSFVVGTGTASFKSRAVFVAAVGVSGTKFDKFNAISATLPNHFNSIMMHENNESGKKQLTLVRILALKR